MGNGEVPLLVSNGFVPPPPPQRQPYVSVNNDGVDTAKQPDLLLEPLELEHPSTGSEHVPHQRRRPIRWVVLSTLLVAFVLFRHVDSPNDGYTGDSETDTQSRLSALTKSLRAATNGDSSSSSSTPPASTETGGSNLEAPQYFADRVIQELSNADGASPPFSTLLIQNPDFTLESLDIFPECCAANNDVNNDPYACNEDPFMPSCAESRLDKFFLNYRGTSAVNDDLTLVWKRDACPAQPIVQTIVLADGAFQGRVALNEHAHYPVVYIPDTSATSCWEFICLSQKLPDCLEVARTSIRQVQREEFQKQLAPVPNV